MKSLLFRLFHGGKLKQFAGIPGPTPHWPMGTATAFFGKRKPWEVCADYHSEFGGVTLIWLAGTPALVINDPELIGEVLDTRFDEFYKDAPHDALAPVITPECMFVTNGEAWKYMRDNSPFNLDGFNRWLPSQVVSLRGVVSEACESLCQQASTSDLVESIRRFSYDAFSVSMWGEPLGDESYQQFMELASVGSRRMTEPPPLQKLPPISPEFYIDRDRWYADFENRVKAAMSGESEDRGDLLHHVAAKGTKLTEKHLALALSAPVFFGGVFSMASAIATTLYGLATQNSEYASALQQEIDDAQVLSDDFDLHRLEQCTKLDHALREAMRLYCPVPLYFRNVVKDRSIEFAGHTLPADTLLMLTNRYLHQSPDHWENPEEFDPTRWENGVAESNPLGSGYFFPFGRGPRTCIGQSFAMVYMKVALATLLSTTKCKIEADAPFKQGFFFAVMFPEKLNAGFEKRP